MRLELLPLKEKTTTAMDTNHKKKEENNPPPKSPRVAERANETHMFLKASWELLACRVSHPIFITGRSKEG